jgi:anaerobic magnesium-protoporphyrin IX monomethyl ester cyclase
MAQTAKRYGLTTVLGGPHLTIMPRESLEPRHAYVDYVFKGEAEHTFLELVDTLQAGRPVQLLPGMHMRGRDGEIISDYSSPMIENLDSLPFPAHDLFKIDKYTNLQPLTDGLDRHARSFTILTSRGCPYKCTFCSKPSRATPGAAAAWTTWWLNGAGWSRTCTPARSASPTISGT